MDVGSAGAAAFGAIHRLVRLAEELARCAVGTGYEDADAGVGAEWVAVDDDRFGEFGDDPVGEFGGGQSSSSSPARNRRSTSATVSARNLRWAPTRMTTRP